MALVFSWKGLFRRIRAMLLRSEVSVTGQCRMCGDCCKDIMILDGGFWVSTEKGFQKLLEEKPEYDRFRITGKDQSGPLCFTCAHLSEAGLCMDHENRPAICRKYPAQRIYYRGCDLRIDCGYRFEALTFRQAWWRLRGKTSPPFETVLKRQLNETQKDHTGS